MTIDKIASGSSICDAGTQRQCSLTAGVAWERGGRGVQEGVDLCIPNADSY